MQRPGRIETWLPMATALLALCLGGFHAPASDGPTFEFGTDGEALGLLEQRGVHTTYVQVWAGAWLNRHGWLGFEEQLHEVHESNHTPVIQLYYWGNELTEYCFRNGCEGPAGLRKDQAGWDRMITELVPLLRREFQGKPVVIVLETEFNKHLRTSEELDEALARKADQIHQGYPAARIVLGFGNWGREDWHVFDRAAAQADEIGLQLMRGYGRDTPDMIRSAPDALLDGARFAQRTFNKPVFVTDVAFSSHGGPDYEDAQADAIERLFQLAPQLREAGVRAVIYRSVLDNPSADTSDYYGEGERYFGLVWTHNRTAKPSFDALVRGMNDAANASAQPPTKDPQTQGPTPDDPSSPWWIAASQETSADDADLIQAWRQAMLASPAANP